MVALNWFLDGVFWLDIIVNFRMSFTHQQTGDEILEPKEIAKNYMNGTFWLDLLSVIPFKNFLAGLDNSEYEKTSYVRAFSILKLSRVLRLSKLIMYLNSTDDFKSSLKVMKLCFFLILYVHFSGCVWVYLN